MAAEFYRKSTALYEEFKRRELHYLNVERSINSNYGTKNQISSSLEDYLEKINKREKESEKSYRDLLKNLEEMDKSTDQMSIKLDKLNVLRNAAVSSNITTMPSMDSAFDRTLSYESAFLRSAPTASYYPSINERTAQVNPIFNYPHLKSDSRSESTQTEHIFCDQCHYPFTRSFNAVIADTAKDSLKHNEIRPLQTASNQDIGPFVNPNKVFNMPSNSNESMQNTSKPFRNLGLSDSLVTETNNFNQGATQNLNVDVTGDSSVVNDGSVSLDAGIYPDSKEITKKDGFLDPSDKIIPQGQVRDQSVNNFAAKGIEDEVSVTTEDNCSKNKMFETAVSKSDDESINHEFDFLESDRRPSVKNKTILPENQISGNDNITENLKPDARCKSNVLESNPVDTSSKVTKVKTYMKSQNNEVTDSGVSKILKNTGSFLAPADTKIDSSLSEGSPSPAHHSADISNHSESDSFSEKETPFTASAAYQALLGNAAAPKAVQKAPSPSDSDSEDEIENVLSSAVRRTSNINFDALTQIQKKEDKKEIIPEVHPKIDKKTSKPVSAGVPQLSKNTRKVLGLETSSGSEMELEVKPTANKIDEEDSDEFDFYN